MKKDDIKQKILDEIFKTTRLIEEYKDLTGQVASHVSIARILLHPESLYCVNCAT